MQTAIRGRQITLGFSTMYLAVGARITWIIHWPSKCQKSRKRCISICLHSPRAGNCPFRIRCTLIKVALLGLIDDSIRVSKEQEDFVVCHNGPLLPFFCAITGAERCYALRCKLTWPAAGWSYVTALVSSCVERACPNSSWKQPVVCRLQSDRHTPGHLLSASCLHCRSFDKSCRGISCYTPCCSYGHRYHVHDLYRTVILNTVWAFMPTSRLYRYYIM